MKILVYSKKKEEALKKGWAFDGQNICHYQNANRKLGMGGGNFYSLSFSLDADYDNDEVLVANLFPYSFTDLRNFLTRVCVSNNKDKVRKCILCNTLAGNQYITLIRCEILIITNFQSNDTEIAKRKAVILTARVHPGESNSSFIIEGLIEYLISNCKEAAILRDSFVFKVYAVNRLFLCSILMGSLWVIIDAP